jgi:hypothetical protein
MVWSTVDNQTLRMWIVSSSYTRLHGQTTDGDCIVGLAMLNGEPVTVDILDAKSALDSDANFTGGKKRVTKVFVFQSISYRFADQCCSYFHRSVPCKPAQYIASGSTTLTTQ